MSGNRSRNRHGQKTEFYHHTCRSKRTALIYIQARATKATDPEIPF